jgi:hypothetical protein
LYFTKVKVLFTVLILGLVQPRLIVPASKH